MAGFRFAPELPKACATSTPHSTASAHPVAITIQPESAAYDLRNVTPAFTPLPSSTRTSVPINSPNQIECIEPSFSEPLHSPLPSPSSPSSKSQRQNAAPFSRLGCRQDCKAKQSEH